MKFFIVYEQYLCHDYNLGCSWTNEDMNLVNEFELLFDKYPRFKADTDRYVMIELGDTEEELQLRRSLKHYTEYFEFNILQPVNILNEVEGIYIPKEYDVFSGCLILKLEDLHKLASEYKFEYAGTYRKDDKPIGPAFDKNNVYINVTVFMKNGMFREQKDLKINVNNIIYNVNNIVANNYLMFKTVSESPSEITIDVSKTKEVDDFIIKLIEDCKNLQIANIKIICLQLQKTKGKEQRIEFIVTYADKSTVEFSYYI